MLDIGHLLVNPSVNIQRFIGHSTVEFGAGVYNVQTWIKPSGVKNLFYIVASGGQSGGCGVNTSNASGGGAGGASGGLQMGLIPTMFLPDTLYVQCGSGGLGPSTSGAQVVNGQSSRISVEPLESGALPQLMLASVTATTTGTAAVASVGTGGTTGSPGTGVTTYSACNIGARGIMWGAAGIGGSAGGSNSTAGVNLTRSTGMFLCGGAGGGGSVGNTGFAGGSITAPTSLVGQNTCPRITGGAAGLNAVPGGNGSNGWGSIWGPILFFSGGAGGGGATTTTGGNAGSGGDGAPGCGGGGTGGTGTANPTMPKAGNGGPGFAILISW